MSAAVLYHAGLTDEEWVTVQALALTSISLSFIGCVYILTSTLVQARKQNYKYVQGLTATVDEAADKHIELRFVISVCTDRRNIPSFH